MKKFYWWLAATVIALVILGVCLYSSGYPLLESVGPNIIADALGIAISVLFIDRLVQHRSAIREQSRSAVVYDRVRDILFQARTLWGHLIYASICDLDQQVSPEKTLEELQTPEWNRLVEDRPLYGIEIRNLVREFDKNIAKVSERKRQLLFSGLKSMARRISNELDSVLSSMGSYMTPKLFAALYDLRSAPLVWVTRSESLDDFGPGFGVTVCASDPDQPSFLSAAASNRSAGEWVVAKSVHTIESELDDIRRLSPGRNFPSLPGPLSYMNIALAMAYRLTGGYESNPPPS